MTNAHIVIGLGFGDEGKGRVTDYLVRKHNAKLVVRFSGGPQCAHNVVSPEGIHHTFAQFGSGALAGARTHLGPRMLLDPGAIFEEARILRDKIGYNPMSGLTIDPKCVVILPEHRDRNRMLEISRGGRRHGSCGIGLGEARRDELSGKAIRAEEIQSLEPYIRDTGDVLMGHSGSVVFEGNQGVLLDEVHGFAPYNTWTDCTFDSADALLDLVGCYERYRIGVLRSYHTRHGAGPFPTEDASLIALEEHNPTHAWMGRFRVGHFDLRLAEYACGIAMPDSIVLTHMDRRPSIKIGYWGDVTKVSEAVPEYMDTTDLPGAVYAITGVPVGMTTVGQSYGQEIVSQITWRGVYEIANT